MISKAKIKWIKSLEQRKHRQEEKLFVAEGPKLVGEMLPHHAPAYLCATHEWMEENGRFLGKAREYDEITRQELEKASLMRAPQSVIAVFPITESPLPDGIATRELCLALDGIQDPGNMGTIMRIADWFGIRHVICSHDTADIYNPKAVQATMGALARVETHYTDLTRFLAGCGAPVFGTFLDGDNIYSQELASNGVIVMGNEGKGVGPQVEALVDKRLYIPNYPAGSTTTESLNVAVATSIVCAEFRRREQQA